jgi:hypothetical protein
LLFAVSNIWRNGGFGYGGVQWAPAGVDREGLTVKLVFGSDLYRYSSGALGNAEVIGRQLSVAILAGWRFAHDKLIVTYSPGPNSRITTCRPTIRRPGCVAPTSAPASVSTPGTSRPN